jgi:ribonuclease III
MFSEQTIDADTWEFSRAEKVLNYVFEDRNSLVSAFSRRSYWHENRDTCADHNERLEFLGDAVLGLVIAEVLYFEFPEDEEGELQKKRAGLVNRSALAQLMRQLDLAEFIRMGKGDEMSGCRDRDSVLADTLEALIAAVYIDGGFEASRRVIVDHFYPLVEKCGTRVGMEDFKSLFQELAQSKFGLTPTYETVNEWGEDHKKNFEVAALMNGQVVGSGAGKNKREAAQRAAQDAMQNLNL